MLIRLLPVFGWVVILLAIIPQSSGEIVLQSTSLNGTRIRSAQFYKKGDDFTSFFEPIEGFLVFGNASNIAGQIAIMDAVPSVQIWPGFLDLYSRGAKAIIYVTDTLVPGQYFCIWTFEELSTFNISIIEASRDDFIDVEKILIEGEQIFVTLTSEGNEWTDVIVNSVATIIVFRVIFGGCSVGLMVYSLYKLVLFVRAQGSHFNVPQVCLALEFISNAWRILFAVVNPFGCFFVFGGALDSFLDTISLPYSTATFVLITFYWHEALVDTSIRIYPFLAKLKIPFFVIMLALIAVDLIVSLTAFYFGVDSTALTIIYVLISAGFIIFYFVTIGKISKRLQVAEGIRNGGRRYRRLSSMVQKMILNGVSKTSMLIMGLTYVFRDVNSRPVPQYIGVTLLTATIYFDSFARIFLFDVKNKNKKSSSHMATSMSRQVSVATLTHNAQLTNAETAPDTTTGAV